MCIVVWFNVGVENKMTITTDKFIKLISFWAYKENRVHITKEDIIDLAQFLNHHMENKENE